MTTYRLIIEFDDEVGHDPMALGRALRQREDRHESEVLTTEQALNELGWAIALDGWAGLPDEWADGTSVLLVDVEVVNPRA